MLFEQMYAAHIEAKKTVEVRLVISFLKSKVLNKQVRDGSWFTTRSNGRNFWISIQSFGRSYHLAKEYVIQSTVISFKITL